MIKIKKMSCVHAAWNDGTKLEPAWFVFWSNGTDESKLRITPEEANEMLTYCPYKKLEDVKIDEHSFVEIYAL